MGIAGLYEGQADPDIENMRGKQMSGAVLWLGGDALGVRFFIKGT